MPITQTPITDQADRELLGYALLALGCSLAGLAAALGATGPDHMMASPADLCGPGAGHCLECAAALLALGAASAVGGLGAWLLTRPRVGLPARARARRSGRP
jgi:hypothetical protein